METFFETFTFSETTIFYIYLGWTLTLFSLHYFLHHLANLLNKYGKEGKERITKRIEVIEGYQEAYDVTLHGFHYCTYDVDGLLETYKIYPN